MNEVDWLAERFEEKRTHLQAVAFRMLGSLSEADDAVQETWLRLTRSDTSGVENLGQPATKVLDTAGVRTGQSQPGLLDGIVRFAQRSEHPERDRLKVRALLLEPLGQPVDLVHRQSLRFRPS